MTDTDQTVVLPRVDSVDVEQAPRPDRWEEPAARGVAQVGGLDSTDAALTRLAWLLATVVMLIVGLVRTGWSSLSADELTTWAVANTSWSQLWELRTELDALTSPYYALIRAWSEVFGTSEFSLRAPSVVAMAIAAGAIAALVSRQVDPRAGALTGILFAAVPASSRFAQHAGPEALATAAGVLSTVALVWLFERPGRWRWLGYFATVVLLGLAHGAALLLLVGHAGAVLALRRRVLPAWLLAAVLGAAPAAGLLFLARRPWDLHPWVEPLGMPSAPEVAVVLFGLALLGGAVVGLGLIGVSARRPAGVFTAAAILPLLGLYPAAEFTGIGLPVLVLFTLPYWLCLVAMALNRSPLVRGLVVVTLVALVGLPTQFDIRSGGGHGIESRQVADVLNARYEPGDAIIYGPTRTDEQIGRDLVARYATADTRPADVLAESEPVLGGGGWLVTECVDVDACVGDAPRLWLFRADTAPDPLDGLPAAKDGTLRVRYELTRTWTFRGASLSLFTLAPAELDRPEPR